LNSRQSDSARGRPAELGTRLGLGRTADVFAWGDGQVLKLFHADFPSEAIERERTAVEALTGLPLAAPRYLGSIQLEDRTGLVFERINGQSMLAVLARQPWRVLGLAGQFAGLHASMHTQEALALESQREYLRRQTERALDLPEHLRSAALERLAVLPDGQRLCHGDFR